MREIIITNTQQGERDHISSFMFLRSFSISANQLQKKFVIKILKKALFFRSVLLPQVKCSVTLVVFYQLKKVKAVNRVSSISSINLRIAKMNNFGEKLLITDDTMYVLHGQKIFFGLNLVS